MEKGVKSTLLLVSGGLFLFALKRNKVTGAPAGERSERRSFSGPSTLLGNNEECSSREFISADFSSGQSESTGRTYSFFKKYKKSDQRLSAYLPPDGEVFLGSLYQVKDGDSPREVCLKALFGSNAEIYSDPWAEDAACDLWQRIQSSTFNLSCYKSKTPVEKNFSNEKNIVSLDSIFFDRVYEDNLLRIHHGSAPSGGTGDSLPLLWIPMINVDVFEKEKKVTTEGVFHDNHCGGSAIDPPAGLFSSGVEQSRTSYDVNL